jgi:16S rRNA processing protein RimM
MPSTSNSSTEGSGPPPADLLEVGRITKAHGLGGEVVVQLSTDRTERLDPGSSLYTVMGWLTVASSRIDGTRPIARFEGIDSRERAETLRGTLYATPLDDPDALWVHELIGCRVVDEAGEHGTVVTVIDNPASDLLELDSGALVPLRFVTGGPADGVIQVSVPEGLWDL